MMPLRALSVAFSLALLSAAGAIKATPPVVADDEGVAIHGYDAVAYFTQGRAVRGSDRHRMRWNGAVWYFTSARTRARFAAEPTGFAPQYGGYCAWEASQNRLAPGDPLVWRIVEGRLYFNCGARALADWESDLQANIARGNANWLRLIGDAMGLQQRASVFD